MLKKKPNELYQVVENQIVEIQTSISISTYILSTSKKRETQSDEPDTDDIVSKIETVKQVMMSKVMSARKLLTKAT